MTITMSTTFGGTRLRFEAVPAHACSWKRRPSVVTFDGYLIDNSTGVSAVECRHRR